MRHFLTYLLQLVAAPTKGWEAVAEADIEPRELCSRGFYPLIGIVALSVFIRRIYDDSYTITGLLQDAGITFMQYFITYFLASFIFAIALPSVISDDSGDETRTNTYIIYNLALLAIINLISNCLPMELSIVQFLPLFVILVLWTGLPYLGVQPQYRMRTFFVSLLAVMVPPYALSFLFHLLMPH